jgi:hypothetical protein
MRAGVGSFHMSISLICLFCLAFDRRVRDGLMVTAVVTGLVVATRAIGLVVDGFAAETVAILKIEASVLAISLLGLILELRKART